MARLAMAMFLWSLCLLGGRPGRWCPLPASSSAYYGVNSLPLGEDRIDEVGENAGYYERATGEEVCGTSPQAAVAARADRAGSGPHRARARGAGAGGERCGICARARCTRSPSVARWSTRATWRRRCRRRTPAVRGRLGRARRARQRAAGRRADRPPATRCSGPARRRSTRAPGSWTTAWSRSGSAGCDRATPGFTTARQFQPLEQVGAIMHGISLDAEAGAQAEDIDDLFERLEASGRLVRIDPSRPADDVSRHDAQRPRARRRAADRGRRPARARPAYRERPDRPRAGRDRTGPEDLHVDCTALGLRDAPATPIFQPGRIVLQQVRHNSPTFNAALLGFVEAHRDDE